MVTLAAQTGSFTRFTRLGANDSFVRLKPLDSTGLPDCLGVMIAVMAVSLTK